MHKLQIAAQFNEASKRFIVSKAPVILVDEELPGSICPVFLFKIKKNEGNHLD